MQNIRSRSYKTGTVGAEGEDFHLNLILHTLFRLKKIEITNFRLYSELAIAGRFDDIVLISEDQNKMKSSYLLQAKHVIDESKTVSFNDLISGNKFGLTKYFDSFKEIIRKEQFKDSLEHLILFTNINLSESLLPYVEVVQSPLPIWNCQPVESSEKQPQLYKLNSKFIDEYQYYQLRVLSNVIIDYCIKDIELKHTNNNFKDCHVLLATEVFNVEKKCFRKEFIEGEQLLPQTKLFRDIFVEELQKRRNDERGILFDDTPMWMRDIQLKFSKEFGHSSSKSKRSNSWPIPLQVDEKELFRRFCDYLILALNQPNDEELEDSLTSECAEYFSEFVANMTRGEIQYRIRKWFKSTESSPLTSQFLDDAMEYIKNNLKL